MKFDPIKNRQRIARQAPVAIRLIASGQKLPA
jgi:hypothetical protein